VKPNNSHEEHKRHSFDSFCKKVIKNEARNSYREEQRQRENEVSFSELSAQELEQLAVTDDYPSDYFTFDVAGHTIAVKSETIAEAIAALPEERRDIILLSYCLDMTDGEISQKLNLVRSTVQYRRASSLRELKKLIGGKNA
jgi:RNA polymerase sigma factor (sigma-70 family)